MTILRWFTKRRLSYMDCIIYSLGFYQGAQGNLIIGAAIMLVGSLGSVCLEMLVERGRPV